MATITMVKKTKTKQRQEDPYGEKVATCIAVNVKVIVVGHYEAGKTSLINRYLNGQFDTDHTMTLVSSVESKLVMAENIGFQLDIWDTTGVTHEPALQIYYRQANAAIVCFDVADTINQSFPTAEFMISKISESEPTCDIYLVGTKVDLLQQNKRDEVRKMVSEYMANKNIKSFIETSAKTNDNINAVFQQIVKQTLYKYQTKDTIHAKQPPMPEIPIPEIPTPEIPMPEIPTTKTTSDKIEDWTVDDVIAWMQTLNLSQSYSDLIRRNFINGQELLAMKMNHDWEVLGVTNVEDLRILGSTPKPRPANEPNYSAYGLKGELCFVQ